MTWVFRKPRKKDVREVFEKAINAYWDGRLEEAMTGFKEVISIGPPYPLTSARFTHTSRPYVTPMNFRAHFLLGNIYARKGMHEKAISEFRKTIEIDSSVGTPHANIGNSLLKLNRIDDAIREYEIALSLDPNDKMAANNLKLAKLVKKTKRK